MDLRADDVIGAINRLLDLLEGGFADEYPNGCTGERCPLMRLPKGGCITKECPWMTVPTGNVVEVIRCKDCTHFEANDEYDYFLCAEHGGVVTPESYCSFAELKEEGEQNDDELKPCPFCGGEAHMRSHAIAPIGDEDDFYQVKCSCCGATSDINCEKNLVVKSWNRRVAMCEWISVTDALPPMAEKCDHDEDVLLFIPPRDGCKQNGIYLGCRRPFVLYENIVEWTVWAWHYLDHPVVTHWMPLPEPPKEGAGG